MARRQFRSSRLPAKKMNTLRWDGLQGAALSQVAGSAAVNILAAGGDAETILRMRGWFSTWLDATSAPGKTVLVSAGMILVPEGQGSTVIWDPFNDVNAPWIWFTEVTLAYDEAVVDVIADQKMTAAIVEIDGKAMRKASPDEELQFVVTNTTLQSPAVVNSSLSGRILIGH